MCQFWSIHCTDQTKTMFLFLLLLLHLSPCTSSICSENEKYNSKKAAQMCFNKLLSKLDVGESCEWFDFGVSDCDKELENCFDQRFIIEMKDYFLEKAINIKQWIFLAQKLLDNAHAKSVFYFFSPFLVNFCPVHRLQWFHIFYEECLHVKTVIRTWPVSKMEFMKCPGVEEYLSSGRKGVFGPVMSCSAHLNQDFNLCVQKHMNILPAKKNSSWKDACNNLQQVNMLC